MLSRKAVRRAVSHGGRWRRSTVEQRRWWSDMPGESFAQTAPHPTRRQSKRFRNEEFRDLWKYMPPLAPPLGSEFLLFPPSMPCPFVQHQRHERRPCAERWSKAAAVRPADGAAQNEAAQKTEGVARDRNTMDESKRGGGEEEIDIVPRRRRQGKAAVDGRVFSLVVSRPRRRLRRGTSQP